MTFLNTKTFNYNSLQKGSFRGQEFYMLADQSKTSGKKTAIHEYVNSNVRYIENLGESKSIYNVELYIDTNSNFNARDNFENSLKDSSIGLLIHPFYGQLNVSTTTYSVINEFGRAKFNVVFYETNEDILPDNVKSTKSFLNNLKNSLGLGQDGKITKAFNVAKGGFKVFQEGVAKVNNITDDFRRVINTINNAIDEVSDLTTTLQEIDDNVATLIKSPADLLNKLNSAFNNLSNIGQNSIDTFNATREFFGFGDDDEEYKTGSFTNNQITSNNNLLNNFVRVNNFTISGITALDIDYTNDQQLIDIQKQLTDEFDNLSLLVDDDTLEDLQLFKSNLDLVFNDLLLKLPEISTIDINGTQNIYQIVYRYYGNFRNSDEYEDKLNEIIDLNKIGNPSLITGEIKLIL